MSDRQEQEKRRERALAVLEIYGADPARWPIAERGGLVEFVETDAVLSVRLAEEKALDRLLASAPAEPPTFALQTRILAQLPTGHIADAQVAPSSFWKQFMNVLWPYGSALVPAGALAISVVLGGTFGVVTVTAASGWTDEQSYEVMAMALGEASLTENWQ